MTRIRGLVVLALLAAACNGATPRPPRPLGASPQSFGGTVFQCPSGFDFAAFGDRYYPPNHPARPALTVRPSRCFSMPSQAQAAGYRLAPTPPGDLLVGGEYLVHVDAGTRGGCQAGAQALGFPVPCPGLVPFGWAQASQCTPCRGIFVLEGGFPGPPGYVGLETDKGRGHLNVWAVPFRSFGPGKPGYEGCPEGVVDGSESVQEATALWITCPTGSGLDSGHIILQWLSHGVFYAVSLHGQTDLNRRLDLAIAGHLEMLGPPSTSI